MTRKTFYFLAGSSRFLNGKNVCIYRALQANDEWIRAEFSGIGEQVLAHYPYFPQLLLLDVIKEINVWTGISSFLIMY